uniref:Uncharacterized protein n=1 Tax=Sphingobacterium sp. (strain 21) TaxID=743722 RepID=F4CCZ0_SPHS2
MKIEIRRLHFVKSGKNKKKSKVISVFFLLAHIGNKRAKSG